MSYRHSPPRTRPSHYSSSGSYHNYGSRSGGGHHHAASSRNTTSRALSPGAQAAMLLDNVGGGAVAEALEARRSTDQFLDSGAPFANKTTRSFTGHKKKVLSVEWNCAGELLASGSADQTARVWKVHSHKTGAELLLRGHTAHVDQLTWHPSNPHELATASSDKTVRFWDARSGKCSHTVKTKGENINIAYNPNGLQVAVGNKEDLVSIIDTRKGKVVTTALFPFEVNELCWTVDSGLFFLTAGNGSVHVICPSDFCESVRQLRGHSANVYSVARTKKYIATGSADACVYLWSLPEMFCERSVSCMNGPVRTIDFSSCGKYLAIGGVDPQIALVSAETGEPAALLHIGTSINSISWSPKDYLLAYAKDPDSRNYGDEVVHVYGFSK